MGSLERVLFVCTANICRSPMAEAIFNDLASERDLPFVAGSAGVAAREGNSQTPNARQALEEVGIPFGPHSSRMLTRRMLEEADLVLVMGPGHLNAVEERFGASGKVRTLPEYVGGPLNVEIPDPYGLTMFAFRASVREIFNYVDSALQKMEKEYKAR